MQANLPLLECIPNFSEGQNEAVINEIREAVESVKDQYLLHIDPSPAANRTVFTFAGNPDNVIEAAFQAIKVAAEKIDMRFQHGTHPRLGSTDVCPLVPLANISMDEAVAYSKRLAERVANELNIPVYLYEYSATEPHRKTLPQIRKGQYERLQEKIKTAGWKPDSGNELSDNWEQVSRTGATIIGARNILVAFNISLNTRDERIAKQIAQKMRSSSGGILPELRAIGWFMEDFDTAQVSMNLLDYRVTSPLKVWEVCKALAATLNVKPIGCEVVGLIPESCVLEAGGWNFTDDLLEENRKILINAGIKYLGLDLVKPFNPDEKILEYALKKFQLI
ncbi:glutamate formimidoyltransferase [Taibaiella lutea]|uniref:glutamate formimidoyltransferase n=1 Tax=Taibaiella lutea TaxID=2608001 RepID=A0A5M6CQ47_9BACT|nr:glutamate formimidoyltransferase [Taibaiella lutea]KAA5537227.1 glutamate formimidoyltransferase [Taibaiella lutea]